MAVNVTGTACAVVFSGQGAQTPHMGKPHHRHLEAFRETYRQARDVLGLDFLAIGEGGGGDFETPEIVQPLLVTFGVASWRSLVEIGVRPQWLAGHSLGEVCALVASGALDFESALHFARERGRAMAACPPGGMAVVVGVDADRVSTCCDQVGNGRVTVANRNLPDQTVISGAEALPEVADALRAAGAVVKPVRVSVAAHSPLMADAAARLEAFTQDLTIRGPDIPVVSTVTGEFLGDSTAIRNNLSQAVTGCVDWVSVMKTLRDNGVEQVIECGPRTVLRDLFSTTVTTVSAVSVSDPEGLSLLGIGHEETDTRAGAQRALRLLVGTPRLVHETTATEATTAAYARLQEIVDRPDSVSPEDVRRLLDDGLRAKGIDEDTRTRLIGRRQEVDR